LASPAVRTQQTAAALQATFRTSDEVGLGATPQTLLAAAGWPDADRAVVIVGHQPTLGMTAARLLAHTERAWHVRKGAIVWITRKGSANVLRAALAPDLV